MDKRQVLHSYIIMKLSERDYHAVSDAANDLRVLDAKGELNGEKMDTRNGYEKGSTSQGIGYSAGAENSLSEIERRSQKDRA